MRRTTHVFRTGVPCVLVLVALLAVVSNAHAESVSISLSAPNACAADSAQLAAMVQSRTKRAVVVAATADPSRRFEVEVWQVRVGGIENGQLDHFRSEMRVNGVASDPIEDPSCQQVIGAVALIIALAIDPSADTAAIVATPLAPTPAPEAAPVSTATPIPQVPVAPRRPSEPTPWWVESNGGFGVAIGPGPSAMPTLSTSAAVGRGRWSLQSGVSLGQTTTMFTGGQLRFRWLSSQTGLCGRVKHLQYAAEACLALAAGTLQTRASQIINATSSARLWLAPGTRIQGQRRLPEVARGLSVFVSFGLWAPVTRDKYIIQPANIIHKTPSSTETFELGAQWKW